VDTGRVAEVGINLAIEELVDTGQVTTAEVAE
jgi:hypothetical protein